LQSWAYGKSNFGADRGDFGKCGSALVSPKWVLSLVPWPPKVCFKPIIKGILAAPQRVVKIFMWPEGALVRIFF